MDDFWGEKILCVDDDAISLSVLVHTLEKHYPIFQATNGVEALELKKEHDIQIIITDIMMPEMDGLELCKTIREFDKLTVMCAVTGQSRLYELLDCREAGFDDYLIKPVDPELLLKVTKEMAGKHKRWIETIKRSARKK